MTRPDPRRPLVLDTRELVRRPGAMHEISRTVRTPEAVGTDIVAVPAGAALEILVRLESVVEGVLVSGSVRATATAVCVRCLDPTTYAVDARFQELFAYPDRAAHHREVGVDGDGDAVYELEGDLVDLEPVLRDAVVPSLPFQPVCGEDCAGLCPECGTRLDDDPDHHHEMSDPRWAALSGLRAAGPATATPQNDQHPEKRT